MVRTTIYSLSSSGSEDFHALSAPYTRFVYVLIQVHFGYISRLHFLSGESSGSSDPSSSPWTPRLDPRATALTQRAPRRHPRGVTHAAPSWGWKEPGEGREACAGAKARPAVGSAFAYSGGEAARCLCNLSFLPPWARSLCARVLRGPTPDSSRAPQHRSIMRQCGDEPLFWYSENI